MLEQMGAAAKAASYKLALLSSREKNRVLEKIADYLDVSLSYLMTGIEETLPENQKLNERDKRDIAKDLDRIMEEIVNDADGPLFYNDQPIPKNKIDLLRNAIEVALEDAKVKNKETFRPYKHKPRPEKN